MAAVGHSQHSYYCLFSLGGWFLQCLSIEELKICLLQYFDSPHLLNVIGRD